MPTYETVKLLRIELNQLLVTNTSLECGFNKIFHEDLDMGCCGSCGGEAPNHTSEQDKSKEKDKEATSQPQEQDKEKK